MIRIQEFSIIETSERLLQEIHAFLNNQIQKRKMKNLNLMHLVMGRYDPKITYLRKMNKAVTKQGNHFQIRSPNSNLQKDQEAMIQSFNEFFVRREPPRPNYSLTIQNKDIDFDKQCHVKRKFLSMYGSGNSFVEFIISSQKQGQKIIVKEGKQIPIQGYNVNVVLQKYIIKLLEHNSYEIVKSEFQNLIENELNKGDKIQILLVQQMFRIQMSRIEKKNEQQQQLNDDFLESKRQEGEVDLIGNK